MNDEQDPSCQQRRIPMARSSGPSLMGTAMFGLVLIFSPFLLLFGITHYLPPVPKIVVEIVSILIVIPLLICWHYRRTLLNTGQGSWVLWFYVAFYALFTVILAQPLKTEFTTAYLLRVLVSGAVPVFLIWYSFYLKRRFQNLEQQFYEEEREEDIERQAQAIVRAREIEKQAN